METKQLSPTFLVTGQLTAADIEEAARLGVSAIVCNRPDGEAPDQPTSLELAAAAARAGLTFEYIPVEPAQPCEREARRLKRFLSTSKGPVLAYCRTGARSEMLWRRAHELTAQER